MQALPDIPGIPQIHQHGVREPALDDADELIRRMGFADDRDPLVALERAAHARQHEWMVIGDHHGQSRCFRQVAPPPGFERHEMFLPDFDSVGPVRRDSTNRQFTTSLYVVREIPRCGSDSRTIYLDPSRRELDLRVVHGRPESDHT